MSTVATPFTLATGSSVTKNVVGKDGMGAVGPITGLQLYNTAGNNISASVNATAQTVTFTATGYGSTTFTFKANNVNGTAIYVEQTVNNPIPIVVTVLEID